MRSRFIWLWVTRPFMMYQAWRLRKAKVIDLDVCTIRCLTGECSTEGIYFTNFDILKEHLLSKHL